MMKRAHFRSEDWVDFVNGALTKERVNQMQGHLNTGCGECKKTVSFWQNVKETAKREMQYSAPESAVKHIQNAFIAAQPLKARGGFEIARLVFDTLWQPATAGTRSTPNTPRQVIYRAGEIVVEMQLEPVPNSERINIAGQVSTSGDEAEGLAKVPVTVSTPKGKLAEASTNHFGEFQMGFVPEKNLRISFQVVGGKEVLIPLDGTGVRIFYRG